MKNIFPFLILLLLSAFAKAQTPLPQIKLQQFAQGFNQPIGIENAGDNRLFILEKEGKIRILDLDGNKSNQPFLDITDRVRSKGSEQGLLGLAFDPNFASNGNFFVSYCDQF